MITQLSIQKRKSSSLLDCKEFYSARFEKSIVSAKQKIKALRAQKCHATSFTK